MMQKIAAYDIDWLEEPIHADRPDNEWVSVKASGDTPLAGGENIMGALGFDKVIEAGCISVIQPDLAKWGGLTKTVPIAKKIISSGKRFCPHYLGGGVGLLASAHALAAVGGSGILEVDINQNPLRTILVDAFFEPSSSIMQLGNSSGLGAEVDFKALSKFRVQLGLAVNFPRTISAPFSAIIMTAAFRFADTIVGIIEASITRKFLTP